MQAKVGIKLAVILKSSSIACGACSAPNGLFSAAIVAVIIIYYTTLLLGLRAALDGGGGIVLGDDAD